MSSQSVSCLAGIMITGLSRLDFMVYSVCHYPSPRDKLGPSLFVLSAPGPQRQKDNRVSPLRLYQLLLQQDGLLVLHTLRTPRHQHPQPRQHRGGRGSPSQPASPPGLLLPPLQSHQEVRRDLRPGDLHELREQGGQVPGRGRVGRHERELQAGSGRQEALLLRPHPPQLQSLGAAGAEEAGHLAQDQSAAGGQERGEAGDLS